MHLLRLLELVVDPLHVLCLAVDVLARRGQPGVDGGNLELELLLECLHIGRQRLDCLRLRSSVQRRPPQAHKRADACHCPPQRSQMGRALVAMQGLGQVAVRRMAPTRTCARKTRW